MKKLKKNESLADEPTDYGKGVAFYEELRPHLIRHNISEAYTMGMDLVSAYGLKAFLNKFKKKGIGTRADANFIRTCTRDVQAGCEVESNNRELIFLLADMIRSTGC